jgi:hypothetical protein
MSRARDPTGQTDSVAAAVHTRAIVSAHLDALRGAGDCARVMREDVALTTMETDEVTEAVHL